MAGRHRRQAARTSVPTQRGSRRSGIIDCRTGVEHLMTDEAMALRRPFGRYVALCGAQVLAASRTTTRARVRCPLCTGAAP